MLFAFPAAADQDVTRSRPVSTSQRATRLLATISGRREYTDPGEKLEDVTMMLFQPVTDSGPEPYVKLIDARARQEIGEEAYFLRLRALYDIRNPHAAIGEEIAVDEDE